MRTAKRIYIAGDNHVPFAFVGVQVVSDSTPSTSGLTEHDIQPGERAPTPNPEQRLPDVPIEQFPRHIAIIMDGNGRWAVQQDRPRIFGHEAGAKTVRNIITECAHLGIEALTLYSFSIENWSRPQDEVDFLMGLYVKYLTAEREKMIANNIQFRQSGRRDGLPVAVVAELDETIAATANCTGLKLVLAINYGSRAEITDAMRSIGEDVQAGKLQPQDIDEACISARMYVPDVPDPDLLIRTAGQLRISNFLLWQISYAELFVSEKYWPDFNTVELHDAIRDYASRDRRFGRVDSSNS